MRAAIESYTLLRRYSNVGHRYTTTFHASNTLKSFILRKR